MTPKKKVVPGPGLWQENWLTICKNKQLPYVYDVDLENLDRVKDFNTIECHLVLYPYSREVRADHFEFNPYEEYVEDLALNQKSAYEKIRNHMAKIFGIGLGLVLLAISISFLKFSNLFDVESMLSIFAAYFIGKDLWDEIEEFLVNISKGWRLRFQDRYYQYRWEKHATLHMYTDLAKKRRYGKASIMPEKMGFIKKSNSQTIRMLFKVKDLTKNNDLSAHILSIRLDPKIVEEFENKGFMFGVKLSFNKRHFVGITRCREFFQSLDKNIAGCLDVDGQWKPGAVFFRNTCLFGRFKYFVDKKLLSDMSIVGLHQ